MEKNQDTTVVAPAETAKVALNPGDVSFRALHRRDNQFYVKFAWCDMFGGQHEHEFARGDIFADFDSVIRVFTNGGLPIDPAKINEFHTRLCQLSTVLVKKEEAPATQEKKA